MMKNLLNALSLTLLIKAINAILIVSVYFIVTIPLSFFIPLSPFKTRAILSRIVQFFCYLMRLNLKIEIELDQSEQSLACLKESNHFIVANHVSYTDIFAIASIAPACFVTSLEMKKTPLLGQITLAAGCLYVDRKNRDNIEKEVKNVVDGLKMD
jgi:lyso-ornithine lipid O-acyltransferase